MSSLVSKLRWKPKKLSKNKRSPMRILMLHNRYDIRGGEDESTDCEYRLLRNRGHDIDLLEAQNSEIGGAISRIEAAASALWSTRWHRRVAEALARKKYDVLHVQNFFPLISPAVYYAASSARVPVVQAVRNYRLVCPSANLFREGEVCTDCVGTTMKIAGIRHACYRDSFIGSATVAAMSSAHRFAGTWRNKVSTFLAISDYVRQTLISDGFNGDKVKVKPNFVETDGVVTPRPPNERQHILYVGRLTREKGLDVLLDAYASTGVDVPLKLVGEGTLGDSAIPGVEILGRRPLKEVYEMMRGAYCIVMPGRWPEPFGRVAIEAFAAGTPVIATDLGGVAEIIEDGCNGFLVAPGDVQTFGERIRRVVTDMDLAGSMAISALNTFNSKYSPDRNHNYLIEAYDHARSRQHNPAN